MTADQFTYANLDVDLPGAAPTKRAKPDIANILVRLG
jgi:hypothetical protein